MRVDVRKGRFRPIIYITIDLHYTFESSKRVFSSIRSEKPTNNPLVPEDTMLSEK